jgi:hypothetical protein
MSESTLHFKAAGQRECVVCGTDLGRRVSRWWLVNCWTSDPTHYRAQQSCHPAETVKPCGVLPKQSTPGAERREDQ